ncbi:MAG: polysaccharide biosynthesis protein [Clostridia bacterium]|nr:polysaccharide biosynthesis protein [Clostridia bacterium]
MEEEINSKEKTNKKSPSFMKNVLILMFAQIMVKVLGLIYKFVITNFDGFGDTGLGYYSAGYQIYALLLALSSIGIPSVVSKLVSERLAIGDNKGAQRIFKLCMTFFTGLGVILSIGLFFGAEFIATAVFNVPDTKYVMRVLAPAISFVAASAVLRGYFAGQNDMKPTSYSQIIEQFFNCVLSITFVYALIGKEPYIMAAGGNLSTTLAIVLTFVYLIAYYKKKKIKVDKNQVSPEKNKTAGQLLKVILTISVPVTISSIISVVNPLIDTATVSRCIQAAFASIYPIKEELEAFAMSMTGILSKVDTIVGLPIAINVAFSTALTPAISASLAKKDYDSASKRMSFSLFASLVIVIPCACGFIALAQPILNLIYPSATAGAGVLMLCSVSMIFIALSQTINGGLYGLGKTYVPAIALAVGAAVKFILNLVLISNPNIGIYGAGISSIICQIIAFSICFTTLNRNIRLKIEWGRMLLAPIVSGIIMGGAVYFINAWLSNVIRPRISTVIAILCGAMIYLLAILFLRVLKKEDIMMIPFGSKIYALLVKLHIYKEEI